MIKKFIIILSILLFCSGGLFAKNYILLLESGPVVCCQPDRKGRVVGNTTKGQLYTMVGELDNWYMVKLFTNECRYVPKTQSQVIKEDQVTEEFAFKLPASEPERKTLYSRIMKAREKAELEAEDKENEQQLRNFLEDHYILQIFQEQKIHPALFSRLEKEAELKHW